MRGERGEIIIPCYLLKLTEAYTRYFISANSAVKIDVTKLMFEQPYLTVFTDLFFSHIIDLERQRRTNDIYDSLILYLIQLQTSARLFKHHWKRCYH